MAKPDMYDDLSAQGNIYGPLVKNTQTETNNGRTPVNPVAQNPMSFNLTDNESDAKKKGFSGPPAA